MRSTEPFIAVIPDSLINQKTMSKNITYQLIYFLVGIIFILTSFSTSESLDIAVNDTYYVIAKRHIYIELGFAFIVFAGIIWTFKRINRSLNKTVLLIHFLITTVTMISFVGLVFLIIERSMPKRYTDYSVYDEFNSTSTDFDLNFWLMVVLIVGVLAQVLFVVNMVLSFFKRNKV